MLIKTRIKSTTELSSFKMLAASPMLVVTTTVTRAIAMSLAFACTIMLSQLIVSLFKKHIPMKLRSLFFITVTAFSASLVEVFTLYLFPGIAASLGIYLPVLAVSCIILIQLESTKADETIGVSLFSALVTSIQMMIAMVVVSIPREILGSGKIFSDVFGKGGIVAFDTAPIPILSETAGLLIFIGIAAALAKFITKSITKSKRENV